jgi:hypothetical protein
MTIIRPTNVLQPLPYILLPLIIGFPGGLIRHTDRDSVRTALMTPPEPSGPIGERICLTVKSRDQGARPRIARSRADLD